MPESPQIDEAGDVRPLDAFRGDLSRAKGGTLITEYSGNADIDAQSGQRGARLEHLRFGMNRETVDALRTATGRDVLAACGVPPTLMVPNSDGTAQREAYRRFLHTALRPMARLMESELRMKLDAPNLHLDMGELHAADSEARSRSFANFIKAGVDPRDAARASSVEMEHPLKAPGDGGA